MVEAQTAIGFTSMSTPSAQVNKPFLHHHQQQYFTYFSTRRHLSFSRTAISVSQKSSRIPTKPFKLSSSLVSYSSSCFVNEVANGNVEENVEKVGSASTSRAEKRRRNRVFLLDVNPLCYDGNVPSLHSFARWISLFFSEVSLSDPVIAVLDGEKGNEYRRKLLPSYKANRRKFNYQNSVFERTRGGGRASGGSHELVTDVLHNCNVPVVKIEAHEADDVVASLVGQVLSRGYHVVIASPDKDFKQLISENVQIVMPMPEFNRWSYYTLKHYIAQYSCDPQSDLSLRCILGDDVDGVPGIQHFVPGFGRRTALKLLKRHGSLENLLNAASVRTVGKQYVQDALKKYADHLRRNYEILSLKRDIDLHIDEQWLSERDSHNDSFVLSHFINFLREKL